MDTPTTISALLDRIDAAHAEFESAIAAIPDERLLAPNTIGTWSVRDVMAHVGGDQRWMAGQLEALRDGTLPTSRSCYGDDLPPPEGDWSSQDARNAWQRERFGALSLDEVRSMAAEAHERLIAAIRSFTDEQLSDKLAIANLGTTAHIRPAKEGEHGWPLVEWIGGVTYRHYAEHLGDIRAVKSSPSGH
jgi:hypothetical protein